MKIAVLVSGGVDSSVALALLQQQGHDVTAYYLKIWLEDELQYLGSCPWEDDLDYVYATCEQLHVPLVILNLQKEYFDRVVAYTIAEVKRGHTPNPDMMCNERIKFGVFYDRIDPSFERVATGHYAGTESRNGSTWLTTTPDPIKDQTYFLAQLSQQQIHRAQFPLQPYTKTQIRQLAKDFNLPAAERKDSQGICFLGKIPYDEFLKFYLGEKPGAIVEFETGKTIGEHPGFYFYTIGQRHGIRLSGGPWYVVQKNVVQNTILVSKQYDRLTRARSEFVVDNINWIAGQTPTTSELMIKLRHGPQQTAATITLRSASAATVKLQQPDAGIAPGQFAVFYDGQYCLGGGTITDDTDT